MLGIGCECLGEIYPMAGTFFACSPGEPTISYFPVVTNIRGIPFPQIFVAKTCKTPQETLNPDLIRVVENSFANTKKPL